MKDLKNILDLISTKDNHNVIYVVFIAIIMSLIEAAGIVSIIPFLAVLGNPDLIFSNKLLNYFYSKAILVGIQTADIFLILLGLVSFFVIIFSSLFRTYANYTMHHFTEMVRHRLETRLLEIFMVKPYSFYVNSHTAEISKTILSEVDHLITNMIRPLINLISHSFVSLAILLVLFLINSWVAICAIFILGAIYSIIYVSLKKKLYSLGKDMIITNKERFLTVSEAFGFIKEIKLYNIEKNYITRFQKASITYAKTHAKQIVINQVPKYIIEAFAYGFILLLLIALMLITGGLSQNTLGDILPIVGIFTFSAYRLIPACQTIYSCLSSLRYGKPLIDSFNFEVQTNAVNNSNSNKEKNLSKTINCIELKNLTLWYPNSIKPALKDINIKIFNSRFIGLVGSTGSGKTSLINIILGLLRHTEGSIKVDGETISEDNPLYKIGTIGYVPQDIFLTNQTVYENIALSTPMDKINVDKVKKCAQMANIHDFVEQQLPDKYDTYVGERGIRLSGGQRQRIGIARALYSNPQILVFDEGTSALDAITEQKIMNSINSIKNNKVIIFVTHSLRTLKKCDQIYVLDQGIIVDSGTHVELQKKCEKYRLLMKSFE
jgi:ABC-type bacteriocin/lantibiotic exporter with double-glycine peptidase domain